MHFLQTSAEVQAAAQAPFGDFAQAASDAGVELVNQASHAIQNLQGSLKDLPTAAQALAVSSAVLVPTVGYMLAKGLGKDEGSPSADMGIAPPQPDSPLRTPTGGAPPVARRPPPSVQGATEAAMSMLPNVNAAASPRRPPPAVQADAEALKAAMAAAIKRLPTPWAEEAAEEAARSNAQIRDRVEQLRGESGQRASMNPMQAPAGMPLPPTIPPLAPPPLQNRPSTPAPGFMAPPPSAEEAAKAAWMAKQEPAWGPKAGAGRHR